MGDYEYDKASTSKLLGVNKESKLPFFLCIGGFEKVSQLEKLAWEKMLGYE